MGVAALLQHQQQRMDKLRDDMENKRQMLSRLREEVSDAETSKIVKNSFRTAFPAVSAVIYNIYR